MLARKYSSSVFPSDPRAQLLLNNLAGLDVEKVLPRRKEPLVVPRYKLMTLDELDEVSGKGRLEVRFRIVSPLINIRHIKKLLIRPDLLLSLLQSYQRDFHAKTFLK